MATNEWALGRDVRDEESGIVGVIVETPPAHGPESTLVIRYRDNNGEEYERVIDQERCQLL